MLGRDIDLGVQVCSWCELDVTVVLGFRCPILRHALHLTFGLALVTFTFKLLSILYLGNHKVWVIEMWQGYWLEGVDVQCNGVTLI